MSSITRLKRIFKKLGLSLALTSSVLFLVGCIFVFVTDNLVSFVFSLILPILLILNLIFGVYCLVKKNKIFFLSFFCVFVYFLCFDSFFKFNSLMTSELGKTSSKLDTLSILSYNTDGFKNNDKDGKVDIGGQIVNFIKNKNTDIFCIQEFSAIKYKYFSDYPYFFKTNIFAGKGKSVMAIFSKYPIIDKGYISFPNSRNGAMYVDLILNKKVIRIYNLHLESYRTNTIHQLNNSKSYSPLINRIGKAEKTRKEQATLVKNHIDNFKGKVVICGDFNSTQFSSVYKLLKHSRKDSFIEAGNYFGSTYKLYKYPFRLDYILVDDSFEVLSHQNFDLKLSDHEPILSSLAIN